MFSVVFQAHDGPTSRAAIVKISREPAVQGRGSCRASLAGIVYDIVSAAFVPVGCEGWRGGGGAHGAECYCYGCSSDSMLMFYTEWTVFVLVSMFYTHVRVEVMCFVSGERGMEKDTKRGRMERRIRVQLSRTRKRER